MHTAGFEAFFERVAQACGLRSQQELASLLGVNRSAITQAKQRNAVPQGWVLKLSRDFGLSPNWVEHGIGPSRLDRADPGEFHQVPKVNARLCAGGGSFEVGGRVEEYYAFRTQWLKRKGSPESMVLMDVFGNSMEPEIKEGDTVLVDQAQKSVYAGSIYAVGVEDTVMVKRVEKHPNTLVLLSDNPDYAAIRLRGEEIENVRIIGKLVWICRELR